MQAYLNDPTLKAAMLDQMAQHVAQDQLIRGTYGNGGIEFPFRGCAIGCALDSLNHITGKVNRTDTHARFPSELGIPIEWAYLIDNVFENLPPDQAIQWPERVLAAITPGANLKPAFVRLLQWTITDPIYGWAAFAKTPEQCGAIKAFSAAVARDWSGLELKISEWDALSNQLDCIPEWAWAWAWVRARARAWAWAWAWVRARARAESDYYSALAEEALRQLASID